MLKLDHITVIAPTLAEGVSHVRDCLDLDVPFGTRHAYMGTHNHRLQLGDNVYLEIVARDPEGAGPGRARWFGLDNERRVRSEWDAGRRLRGWVASTDDIAAEIARRSALFGDLVPLPPAAPVFAFSIPADGSLPLQGAAPSLIDHKGDPTSMADIPDLGARLHGLSLEHEDPSAIDRLYGDLSIDRPPKVVPGSILRFLATIETPTGLKELT